MSDAEEQKEPAQIKGGEEEGFDMDDADHLDENVFNQNNEVMDDNIETLFACSSPTMSGGHIVYKCKGVD